MKTIKTFEDACKVKGLDAKTVLPDFSAFPENHRAGMEAHAKLVIICEALNFVENDNKPWAPDWTNGKWDKYYPWFTMGSPSGSGFSYDGYDYWISNSRCGSRLCFKSRELAIYAGQQFEGLYKAYFTL